jgi:hypothetical protein
MHELQSIYLQLYKQNHRPKSFIAHHLYSNAADAPEIKRLLAVLAVQVVKGWAKQVDDEVVDHTFNARVPEGWHALASL